MAWESNTSLVKSWRAERKGQDDAHPSATGSILYMAFYFLLSLCNLKPPIACQYDRLLPSFISRMIDGAIQDQDQDPKLKAAK
jgi:hypothetical protein